MGMGISADMGSASTGAIQAQNETIKFYWTLPASAGEVNSKNQIFLSPCETIENKVDNAEYIIGRSYNSVENKSMEESYCVYRGSLVAYKEWNGEKYRFIVDDTGF